MARHMTRSIGPHLMLPRQPMSRDCRDAREAGNAIDDERQYRDRGNSARLIAR